MHRRNLVLGDMEDDIQLVHDESVPDIASQPRIKEETHVIPHRLAVLKRKVIIKASSPRGKLLYWWITVFFLGLLSFLFVLIPLLVGKLDKRDCSEYEIDDNDLPYFYRTESGGFEICRQRKMVLEGNIGVGRSYLSEVKVNVFTHSMNSTLNITNLNKNCLLVQWTGASSKAIPLQDCYEIGESNWYGAYEQQKQYWPINMSDFTQEPLSSPFLPHDYLSHTSAYAFGPILHPLWLNTNGVGILVAEGVQLHVTMNGTQLCLIARPFELDCFSDAVEQAFLNYTVCVFDTVAQTARYYLNDSGLIPKSKATPSPAVFQNPIWSTWAEYKANITTDKISKFCSDIVSNQFNRSQLEIDDGYSSFYGELEFNANVSIDGLVSCKGFNITAWVHPFVNYDASNFKQGLEDGLYLPGISLLDSNGVSLVKWWRDYGAVINFVKNSTAMAQAVSLLAFKDAYNLTSFKFDGGEYTYLPKCIHIEGLSHPGHFTKSYVRFVSDQPYSDHAEVRVGFYTQELPILVRILDRASTWSMENGLKSVLTAILSVGLGGYRFVMPDMIGGNAFDGIKPPLELFIRWVQLNTFLPVMQFSIAPWRYDNITTEHVRALTQLHYSLEFQKYAEETIDTGFPIIRPLWWRAVESNDNKTWTIFDQFFLGDDYMVAPVLSEDVRTREVYFPLGSDYSIVNTEISAESVCPNNVCVGGLTYSFTVNLHNVLYFNVLD